MPTDAETIAANLDWGDEFSAIPDMTLGCVCGREFRGIARYVVEEGFRGMISRDPCPRCGKRASICSGRSDPEEFTIRG